MNYLELATATDTFIIWTSCEGCYLDISENVSLEDAILAMHHDNIGTNPVDVEVRIATMQGNRVDLLCERDSRKYQECTIAGILISSEYAKWATDYLDSDGSDPRDYDGQELLEEIGF